MNKLPVFLLCILLTGCSGNENVDPAQDTLLRGFRSSKSVSSVAESMESRETVLNNNDAISIMAQIDHQAYNDPSYLVARHGIEDRQKVIATIKKALGKSGNRGHCTVAAATGPFRLPHPRKSLENVACFCRANEKLGCIASQSKFARPTRKAI